MDRAERTDLHYFIRSKLPAAMRVNTGTCAVVMRIEDAMLYELAGLITEFFCYGTGQCVLSDGSAVLVSSVSHLLACGLCNYAEELVKLISNISRITGRNVQISHGIPVPLGGVGGEGGVRVLADLDGWLSAGNLHGKHTLPKARSVFWEIVEKQGVSPGGIGKSEIVYFLPESVLNPRKVSFAAPPIKGTFPVKSYRFLSAREKSFHSLVNELNSVLGLSLSDNFNINRICADPLTSDGDRCAICIGASHVSRIANALKGIGFHVNDFAKPGWAGNREEVQKIENRLLELPPLNTDIIIIDPFCNVTFFGTDESGCPK